MVTIKYSEKLMRIKINTTIAKYKTSSIFRGFVATLIGSGASKILFVAVTFVGSNMLGKEQFGELSFVRNTLDMFLCVCALNYSSLCTKLTTEAYKQDSAIHKLVLVFLFTFCLCIVCGLLLLVAPKNIMNNLFSTSMVVAFFRVAGILFPIFILQPLLEGILRGLQKFKLIGYLQTVSSLIYLIAMFLGIRIGGLMGAFYAVVIYYVCYSFICLSFLCKSIDVLSQIKRIHGFLAERQSIYKLILPVFLMSFIDAPSYWIAQVILSNYGGIESVGSMVAIMQLTNLAILIPNYFSNTFIAFAGEYNAQKQYDLYYAKFDQFGKLFMMLGFSVTVVLSVISPFVLRLYGSDFVSDWPALIYGSLCIPILMLLSLYKIDLILREHQQMLLYIAIVWNGVWLLSLIALLKIGVAPINSFFISRAIGAFVYVALVWSDYSKGKKVRYTKY